MNIRTFIFDLGNVLFKADMSKVIEHWTNLSSLSVQKINSCILDHKIHFQFERGQVTPEDFIKHVQNVLDIPVSYRELVTDWNSIYGDVIQKNYRSILDCRQFGKVIAFTNTNEIHLPIWMQKYHEQLSIFDKIYSSCEIGLRKPDAESFQYILEDLEVQPAETIFFDDRVENIEAANKLGINSVLVDTDNRVTSVVSKLVKKISNT